MKTKTKFFIAFSIILALIAGFLLGTLMNSPSADKSDLSGTIGKVNNYRNVKISENDIKLRSELLNNDELCQQLLRYFTFQYAFNVQLATNIDLALKASVDVQQFSGKYADEIKSLKGVNTYLIEVRKDYLLLLAALQRIKETEQQSTGLLINNAYNAVIQTGARNQTVVQFTDAIMDFFKTEAMVNYPELVKAHDALLINLVRNSAVNGDKMMIRFLDKKEFLGSKENLQSTAFCSQSFLNSTAISDMAGLESILSLSDKQNLSSIFAFSDKQNLGSRVISDKENLGGRAIGDKENLGGRAIGDKENLGGRAIGDKENLGGRAIGDKENLGGRAISDKENLQSQQLFSAEALNMLFLNDASQFLSSQKSDLGSRFVFDAHTLESSAFFSDKENLSARSLGRAEVLGSVMNPDNLNLYLQQ